LDPSVFNPEEVFDPEEVFNPEDEDAATDRRGSRWRKARTAEQLLKASRLLETVEDPDEDRSHLVARIRVEAAKLLSE
jgi:hypothetical protein